MYTHQNYSSRRLIKIEEDKKKETHSQHTEEKPFCRCGVETTVNSYRSALFTLFESLEGTLKDIVVFVDCVLNIEIKINEL